MKHVDIYTDGSCSGNPGPGGWGAILIYKGVERELSGGERDTTNNRMEMMAAICALELLKEKCSVTLYTDSKYIEQALNAGWLKNWKRRGWKKADNAPVANVDLWKKLDELLESHEVELRWVKGHAENEYNNRCDTLAVAQTKKFSQI